MDTLFLKIIAGEIPSYKIYEDEFVYAFLDISQVTPGHTLVVPKEHCSSMLDASPEQVTHVYLAAQKIAQSIVKELGANGCNILTNAGKAADQTVFHWHVHIIPRFDENDGLVLRFEPKDLPEDKDAHFKKLQEQLQLNDNE